ncbi:hypothetical protein FEM48_Zijuj08G0107900 [Ziziphus jujuba var. spinosa]|uniref:Uncharacterized protein n=1 Tax=Ziziphus jujuba var. spinosa TaxID=714518 RepID=A0A978UYN1_ZIZJJ|nr:hypothetical protein FEM48_Zijuj08G0107900 [Ziziphus jujuba var. spinosa]
MLAPFESKMERSHLKSSIEDSRRFALFENRQWLCGENLMENTIVLSLMDQSEGTIEIPTQKHFSYIVPSISYNFSSISHLNRVSHHPMIVACHYEGKGWKFWVTTSINNLILGKLYCDHCGTMRIQGNHNYSCKLKFKEQSVIDQNPHQEKLSPLDLRLRLDQSLRLTYKAYVEDDEDDKAEAESNDIDALDCEETKYSKEADKESFMDVLVALIVSEEYRGIVASETGTTKILNNVSRVESRISRSLGLNDESAPQDSNNSLECSQGNSLTLLSV